MGKHLGSRPTATPATGLWSLPIGKTSRTYTNLLMALPTVRAGAGGIRPSSNIHIYQSCMKCIQYPREAMRIYISTIIPLDWVRSQHSSLLKVLPKVANCVIGHTKYPVKASEKDSTSKDTWMSPLIDARSSKWRSMASRMGRDSNYNVQ